MAADITTAQTVDALLNDADFDSDDPFGDKPTKAADRDDKATLSPRKRKVDDLFGSLDEEVKIVKARKKIPKLDTERLLSEPGLPKVRALVRSGELKKKLRLRGKGHEFNDVAKLLNYYQGWLDQLYPRAKFTDAIQMVEKAGHTKKLQIYRKSWIDEGKPGFVSKEAADRAVEQERDAHDNSTAQIVQSNTTAVNIDEEDPDSLFFGAGGQEPDIDNGPDDDELEALMALETAAPVHQRKALVQEDNEGEDDLDALLQAEEADRRRREQNFDQHDELDAMLEADMMRSMHTSKDGNDSAFTKSNDAGDATSSVGPIRPAAVIVRKESRTSVEAGSELEPDELGALLTTESSTIETEPSLPPVPTSSKFPPGIRNAASHPSSEVPELDTGMSSSPIPNIGTDELDDLIDEHDALIQQKSAEAGIIDSTLSGSVHA